MTLNSCTNEPLSGKSSEVTGFSDWGQRLGSVTGVSDWGQRLGSATGVSDWGQRLGSATGVSDWGQRLGSATGVSNWGQHSVITLFVLCKTAEKISLAFYTAFIS